MAEHGLSLDPLGNEQYTNNKGITFVVRYAPDGTRRYISNGRVYRVPAEGARRGGKKGRKLRKPHTK